MDEDILIKFKLFNKNYNHQTEKLITLTLVELGTHLLEPPTEVISVEAPGTGEVEDFKIRYVMADASLGGNKKSFEKVLSLSYILTPQFKDDYLRKYKVLSREVFID